MTSLSHDLVYDATLLSLVIDSIYLRKVYTIMALSRESMMDIQGRACPHYNPTQAAFQLFKVGVKTSTDITTEW